MDEYGTLTTPGLISTDDWQPFGDDDYYRYHHHYYDYHDCDYYPPTLPTFLPLLHKHTQTRRGCYLRQMKGQTHDTKYDRQ